MENHDSEFDGLYVKIFREAYNFAYRLCGNREDADDLVQDAFVRAFKSFERYKRALPFKNWLFRIMSNRFVDTLRSKPPPIVSLDAPRLIGQGDEELPLDVVDPNGDASTSLMADALNEELERALAALNPEFRVAVILCDIEGLSYAEIAEVTRVSIGTVRSRIHRGRMMLRAYFGVPVAPRKQYKPRTKGGEG